MTPLELESLLVIAAAAALAPLIVDAIPRIRLPVAVIEIALGIIVGPQVLGLAVTDSVVNALSEFGLALLFFLAGFEIDLNRIRGRPLRLATRGWLISLALALAAAGVLRGVGLTSTIVYVALAMSTTAMGTLMPILRDARQSETRFGTFVLGAGAVGEFGPILLMALLLNQERGELATIAILTLFALIVLAGVMLARRWRPQRIARLIHQTMHSSAQLAVRLTIVLIVALVFIAEEFQLDFLLGAFAAGIIVGQVIAFAGEESEEDIELLHHKYEGLGFGFFIAIFFVVTGVTFDLDALLGSASALALLPVFLALFLLVRGLPAILLYRRDLSARDRISLAILSATELPLVVAITDAGVESGRLSVDIASAMVGAAMLSVFLFPLIALAGRTTDADSQTGDAIEQPVPLQITT